MSSFWRVVIHRYNKKKEREKLTKRKTKKEKHTLGAIFCLYTASVLNSRPNGLDITAFMCSSSLKPAGTAVNWNREHHN
jgi:hypothetical protein